MTRVASTLYLMDPFFRSRLYGSGSGRRLSKLNEWTPAGSFCVAPDADPQRKDSECNKYSLPEYWTVLCRSGRVSENLHSAFPLTIKRSPKTMKTKCQTMRCRCKHLSTKELSTFTELHCHLSLGLTEKFHHSPWQVTALFSLNTTVPAIAEAKYLNSFEELLQTHVFHLRELCLPETPHLGCWWTSSP